MLNPMKKPTTVMTKYTPTAPRSSWMAPTFPASLPKRMEKGMATIWVTSRARIMLTVSRPSFVPYEVDTEMMVFTPSM